MNVSSSAVGCRLLKLDCICDRKRMAYECGNCHHYFHGRIGKKCPVHPNVIYLMDFRSCPYCMTPTSNIMISPISWEQIRKIEDAPLPDADDGL